MHGLDLNENGEWVKVPLENVIPQWVYEDLSEDDEDDGTEIVLVIPYLADEFKKWLMTRRDLSAKSADDYIRAYESAYESLYEIVEIDLYDMLHLLFVEIPEMTKNDSSKAMAPGFVKTYVETMFEELDVDEDSYTNAERRAMEAYHAFIVEVAGTSDQTYLKEKTSPLPDEEDFLLWLEKEYKMDYYNSGKIVSSIKNMDLVLPSLVSDPMTFLDVLRALPAGNKRKNYLKMVRARKKSIARKTSLTEKTISNGLANLNYYLNFLNSNK